MGLVPSGSADVVDAYWLGVNLGRWCFNSDAGPDPFQLGPDEEVLISGVGPARFFDLEGDEDPDLIALRNDALEFQIVTPPASAEVAGTVVKLDFGGVIDPLPSGYVDLALARLDDGDQPELLLLDKGSEDGGVTFESTRLTLVRDLVIDAQVRPTGDGFETTQEYAATSTPPNRFVIGSFREARQLIYVLPSRPASGLAFCREAIVNSGDLELAECAP
jgi:hypothetical protein